MRGRQVSLAAVIWIVIGMIVAANHHFLEHLDSLSGVLSAVLAVAVWPLVMLKVHFGI
jgi:ABC-type anion transport system duplicated permease subunit